MRTTVLLSMVLLISACGVVEERKDAALRQLGKATLNGVFRLASSGEAQSSAPVVRHQEEAEVVVAEASSQPAPAPVVVAKAQAPSAAAEPSAPIMVADQDSTEFSFTHSRVDPIPASTARVMLRKRRAILREHEELAKLAKVTLHEVEMNRMVHEHAVSSARTAAAVLAERPREISRFEVHFAEDLEKVLELPPAPEAPRAPEKTCTSQQVRTAS